MVDPAETAPSPDLVERLNAEINELRAALRQRAVIEEATGLLAGRLGCGLSDAFQHLNQIALDTDMTIEEVAHLLLVDGPAVLPSGTLIGAGDASIFSKEAILARAAQPLRPVLEPAEPAPLAPADLVVLADVIPLPTMVLSPVYGADGEITDFRIDHCNAESRLLRAPGSDASVTGERLLRVFPEVESTGLMHTYVQAMRTGEPLKLDLFPFASMVNGQHTARTVDIRAHSAGDRLLVTWRVHDSASERARRVADAERLGHIGWAEWNLLTDAVSWSFELYGMHGRSLADGPLTLDTYREIVHPEDLPVIEGLLRGLTERGEDTEVEFRIQPSGSEARHIKVSATAVTDPGGKLLLLRGVFQDVTEQRRAERELSAARAGVERLRHEQTLRLQRALLPDVSRQVSAEGYDLAVRYVPAGLGDKAGGDWYEVRRRTDGSLFIAIGDVAGHGLDAAAGMARISYALRGLSATGARCDEMLCALNQLVCQTEDLETIASAVVGILSPDQRLLRWAQAGHPPPVLLRDGAAVLLERSQGLMLGTAAAAGYSQTQTRLQPGDLLLWYTDGLIERRNHDIDAGIARLLDAVPGCPRASAEEFLTGLLYRLGPSSSGDDTCLIAVRVTGPRVAG